MLFLPKNRISIVHADKSISSLPLQEFDFVPPYTFVHRCDAKRYELGALLSAAIEQGQIQETYANACAIVAAKLVNGQFFRIDLASLKREWGIPSELRAYTVELPTAIMGSLVDSSMEHSFPNLFHIDENAILIGSSAHTDARYTLETMLQVFFCKEDSEWKKAFFKSLMEHSIRTYGPAIQSLFTTFDLLTGGLVKGQTKIEMRLTELNKSHPVNGFNRLKKNFEKKIMKPFDALRHANTPVGYFEMLAAYKAAFPILWWLEMNGLT